MSVKKNIRKVLAVAASTTLAVVGLAASASAYGGETGSLLIHGPGTAYTGGHGSIVAISTTAGGSASFSFEVKNTGTATAQYNLMVFNNVEYCPATCAVPVLALTSGSVIGTPLAQSGNGYFTPPIAAGKTGVFTLKATLPAGSAPGSEWYQYLQLSDTSHNYLDNTNAVETVTAAKANAGNDQIVTGAGSQKPVVNTAANSFISDPSAVGGAKSVYTVKLENDSAASTQIGYRLFDNSSCASDFPATVKIGTADVTAAVIGGTYKTPALAPGKSVTLTVTVTYSGNANYCGTGQGSDDWVGQSTDGTDPAQAAYLITNPVAS